jgi:hypothetical protein
LCATQEELAPLCAENQTVDTLAEMNGLTKCGINGVYVAVKQINEI